MYEIELDVGWRDESLDREPTVENAADEVRAFLEHYEAADALTYRVVNPFGSGGGAIIAAFVGPRDDLERLVREYVRESAWESDGEGGYRMAPLDEDEVALFLEGLRKIA